MRKNFLFVGIIFISSVLFAVASDKQNKDEQSNQQIEDFNLAGYGEKGKKTWEVTGKNADIFASMVKLTDIVAKVYGAEENMQITADKGSFDKQQGKMRLENNVVATTDSGARLTTDSLDWDRKQQIVTTLDKVDIVKNGMHTVGTGALGKMGLKTVTLEKEVTVQIAPQDKTKAESTINIVCDGPLEVDYGKEVAVFNNNVVADDGQNKIYSDRMDINFSMSDEIDPATKQKKGKIKQIVAEGNVKIIKDQNVTYAQKAVYLAEEKKVVLSGRPKLVIVSNSGGLDASFGN